MMDYTFLGTAFNQTFTQHTAVINDLKIHYVIGGQGEPLVLLHGFPQTWYSFRYVMPELARYYTVIVPDLPGLGNSEKPQLGYDTYTVANYIHELVHQLGFSKIRLLGHDFGAQVAYAYAATYRAQVDKLVILDIGIFDNSISEYPILPKAGRILWWFPFHSIADLPEKLIAGREELYLGWFYENGTARKTAIKQKDIKEYVRTYAKPGAMKAAFSYYRSLPKTIELNMEQFNHKLAIPVLAVGGEQSFGSLVETAWRKVAAEVKGLVISDCGHYIAEEQPKPLLKGLLSFL